MRNSLIADGTIVDGVFAKDHTFTSSSAAASVVLGRAANGRKEWTLLEAGHMGSMDSWRARNKPKEPRMSTWH